MPSVNSKLIDTELVWTKVAPMKWCKLAPPTSASTAEAAIVPSAKRAKTLAADKMPDDCDNWLDFLEHMDYDAYITLMRYMVGTGVIEHHDWAAAGNLKAYKYKPTCTFYLPGYPYCRLDRDINIYGLQYSTDEGYYEYDEDDDNYESCIEIPYRHVKKMDKKNLLAAAEANAIKVYKSWSKPRIWKALLSAQ